jgi:hypothetical protein
MPAADETIIAQIETAALAGQIARNRAPLDASIRARAVTPYTEKSCATGKAPGSTTAKGVQIGVKAAGATANAIAIAMQGLPLIGQVLGAVVAVFGKVFGMFSAHHQMAVAKEQATLCSLVPQLDAALKLADANFKAGKWTRDEALSYLTNTSEEYKSASSGIFKSCNAACFYDREFDAQIDVRRQIDYAKFVIPQWAKYAGGIAAAGAGIFFIGRKLV